MSQQLTIEKTKQILADTVVTFHHEECRTCECFQTLLAQLESDGGKDVVRLLEPYKVSREDMHHFLGCEPCGPGNTYAEYMF